jgi:hypothetical protein
MHFPQSIVTPVARASRGGFPRKSLNWIDVEREQFLRANGNEAVANRAANSPVRRHDDGNPAATTQHGEAPIASDALQQSTAILCGRALLPKLAPYKRLFARTKSGLKTAVNARWDCLRP